MAGIRLHIARPIPPPPYGFAYLIDGVGRILTDQDGKLLIAPYFPIPFDGLTDEDGSALTDEFGAQFISEQN